MLKTPRERYMTDPAFHQLVDVIAGWYETSNATPTEVREAAMLAAMIVEARRPGPPITPLTATPDEE